MRKKRLAIIAKEIAVRGYCLALLAALGLAAFFAARSIVRTVFIAMSVPERTTAWRARIEPADFQRPAVSEFAISSGRAPLAHYHGVARWFEPGGASGCTTAGCHDPLPHRADEKASAFANFHSTFLDCQMCHESPRGKVIWISSRDARPQETPAALRLLHFLQTREESIAQDPGAAHAPILAMFRQVVASAPRDDAMADLLLQLDACEPGSPVWSRAIEQLGRQLVSHTQGNYGARLAREERPGDARNAAEQWKQHARRYAAADGPARKRIVTETHSGLLKQPASCVACHGEQPPALDYEALGYTPKRAALLAQLKLARLMQQIREGRQFYLNAVLEGNHGK